MQFMSHALHILEFSIKYYFCIQHFKVKILSIPILLLDLHWSLAVQHDSYHIYIISLTFVILLLIERYYRGFRGGKHFNLHLLEA